MLDMLDLETVLVVCVAGLAILVEHFIPWDALVGGKLHVTWRYLMGVLAIAVPMSIYLVEKGLVHTLGVFWMIIGICGIGTVAGYLVDGWIGVNGKLDATLSENQVLREERGHDTRIDDRAG